MTFSIGKKIIALAVAAVASSAAFAQSNVTVYGVVDNYVANVNTGGTKVTAVNAGGLQTPRIGFKGVEDLGGGTKALFTLEYNLATDVGTGPTARQSLVGLTGDYGTAIIGRMNSLAHNHNAAYNVTFGTAFDTQVSAIAGVNGATSVTAASNLAIGHAERLNNAVAYVAPTIVNGLTLAAAHTTNAIADDTAYSAAVRASEVSAAYTTGPLSVGGVYRRVNQLTGSGNDSTSVGASYDFGVAKVFGNIANSKATNVAEDLEAAKYSVQTLGVAAPVSAKGAVILSVATATRKGGVATTGDLNDLRATTSVVAYKHSPSARTSLYAGVAQATGNDQTAATLAGVASGAGGKVTVALAGINHNF